MRLPLATISLMSSFVSFTTASAAPGRVSGITCLRSYTNRDCRVRCFGGHLSVLGASGLPRRPLDDDRNDWGGLRKINFFGLQDIDQRKDEPAFAVFASAARYPATLYDLRPLKRALHQIAPEQLSASDSGLLYWADAYDAIVCYREVTPADR